MRSHWAIFNYYRKKFIDRFLLYQVLMLQPTFSERAIRTSTKIHMANEAFLSLEETNAIRIKLGLKPIEEAVKQRQNEQKSSLPGERGQIENGLAPSGASQDNVATTVRGYHSEINLFRSHNVSTDKEYPRSGDDLRLKNADDDWLDKVGKQISKETDNTGVVTVREDDDTLPQLQTAHDVHKFRSGRDVILTLKESSIKEDGSDDDILENEDLAYEKETKKNVELKQMNKNRRRRKLTLDVSSKDIAQKDSEGDESEREHDLLVVGGKTQLRHKNEEPKTEHVEGKIKVMFDSDGGSDGESDNGDFKSIKIKKRQKKISGNDKNKRTKRIQLPTEIHAVSLDTGDEEEGEGTFDMPLALKVTRRGKVDMENQAQSYSAEEIAIQIQREASERAMMVERLNNKSGGVTVDENSAFFDSLQTALLSPRKNDMLDDPADISNSPEHKEQDAVKSIQYASAPKGAMDSGKAESKSADFYSGLASTLHFLQDNAILTKDHGGDSRHITTGDGENFPESTSLNEERSAPDESAAQYDPKVNLVYRDEKGNELTPKEAYKKLSQKFHGTKSNKKKQEKFDQKVKARAAPRQDVMDFGFNNK
ncbi:U4/U6-U5 snRNP complex subunit SNU66 KNAG_0G03180 [Huiozyma naganishii CBS 8797]|uniref:Uncharacterized protein n=1 Tax=Huiozyma naganishii (strain ATCC MYA-139 / BCRC 22969 / CBS 8797 / KCTC 17520 / NBRC 10181 / NCYC 3082 / Yp74L-3) TaxID=1071383 RepID=J7R927_HUIN7|nr:hypothetical protein KNAG_0G03180 [Kazachstania naganishii CBS 8797]CCK71375.1 hypothetical protein KNAG_0G03180 [Kazachstania naganishii CBS 8797]